MVCRLATGVHVSFLIVVCFCFFFKWFFVVFFAAQLCCWAQTFALGCNNLYCKCKPDKMKASRVGALHLNTKTAVSVFHLALNIRGAESLFLIYLYLFSWIFVPADRQSTWNIIITHLKCFNYSVI